VNQMLWIGCSTVPLLADYSDVFGIVTLTISRLRKCLRLLSRRNQDVKISVSMKIDVTRDSSHTPMSLLNDQKMVLDDDGTREMS